MFSYFFIVIIFLPTIDLAFYEADSDNSDCYDDDDSTSNVTTTTQGPTETYTFPSTTALQSYWRCEQGFIMMNRTTGIWCVIAYQNGTYFNRMQGHEHCVQRHNAILTGIGSEAEKTQISNYIVSIIGPEAVLFVGAQKYTKCRSASNSEFSSCSTNAFFWYNYTSQFLTQQATYGWADNYPTGFPNDLESSTSLIYGAFSYKLGGVYDLSGTAKIGGALCGKPAVEYKMLGKNHRMQKMISYFFILIIFLPTIDVAFYEADSDNSDCYDDEDKSNVTTTTPATTKEYTFAPTTSLKGYFRCEPGFRMFKRTLGNWCITNYVNNTNGNTFNRQQAHEYCSKIYGGILTGIASEAERVELLDWMSGLYSAGKLFVGTQKYTACRDITNVNFTIRCVDRRPFFYYNRTYQFLEQDEAIYGWATGYPRDANNAANQNLVYGAFTVENGGVIDVTGAYKIQGALCGKPAVEVFF
ncbi:unnamed protein product [Caenorhabditis angaria]|uniref:C-type lectin domain-containing protein n=1 Tax=Caenorhabditis angaria TaxID=860376 RepID=A0A9P1IL08_9PELO|nr:unnamed protein product [Caenorhabditis angaria]